MRIAIAEVGQETDSFSPQPTTLDDDFEGSLLAQARRLLGPDVPIVTPLDHHANVTRRSVANRDPMVAFPTQPWLDAFWEGDRVRGARP